MNRYFEPYIEFRSRSLRISLETPRGEKIFIEIAPGSSFGAEHQTTKLCLRGIEEIFKTGSIKTALDFGCGSGVLGISAALLGAESVLAIDLDPIAVDETIRNAELNGVNSKVQVRQGSIEDMQGKFNLVIANIVANDLLLMRERIKSSVEEGGTLLVSGIFEYNKEKVISGFSKIGFNLAREFAEGGWVALWFEVS